MFIEPRTKTLTSLIVLALGLVAPLASQTVGRLDIRVKDQNGEAIQGASVTLTQIGGSATTFERTTNKRGAAIIAVKDATFNYSLSISADGFQPVETQVKPIVSETKRFSYELMKFGSAPAPSPADETETPRELTNTPAEAKHNEGVEALRSGDPEGALALFDEALALEPDLVPAHSALAGIHLQQGRLDQAVSAAERLLELEPNSVRAINILYDAGQQKGDDKLVKRAERLFEDAGVSLDNPAFKYNQATDALALGDLQTAKGLYEQALALEPTLTPAQAGLATVEHALGNYAAAAELAEKVLAVDSDSLRALRIRYDSYSKLGDSAKEQEAFDQLAQHDPETLATQLYEQANQLFNAGQTEQAQDLLLKVLRADDSHVDAYFLLGLCAVNTGDIAIAKQNFEKYLSFGPTGDNAETARQMLQHL